MVTRCVCGLWADGVVKRRTLLIAREAEALILELSRAEYPRETGGVVAGFTSTERIVITHATGPGPRSERARATFRRDGASTQQAIDRIFAETSGVSDYIGEWHSHPSPVGPSAMDRHAMMRISRSLAYRTPEPLLVIAQRSRWRKWRLIGFRWTEGGLVQVRMIRRDC